MKKLILLLLLFLTQYAVAQNYQCLQSGVKHYFTNTNGYLRGIRIDSVRISGTDTIYYPFHSPRGAYPWLVSGGTSPFPLDSMGGSWLGRKVIRQTDGTFLFDNIWMGGSVTIKTQAHLGDTWLFYNDTSSYNFRATVTALDTMTVLGVLDSVKALSIAAYNSTTPLPADSANTYSIVLSKNNGFVKVFDLHTFPFHPPGAAYNLGYDYYMDALSYFSGSYVLSARNVTFALVPFINPTWTELYDRFPGDQFEYYYSAIGDIHLQPTRIYWLDSVSSRSANPDSITCNIRGWDAYQSSPPPPYVPGDYPYYFSNTNYNSTYYNVPIMDTGMMPEECGSRQFIHYFPGDTSFGLSSAAYRFSRNDLEGNSYDYNIHFENSGPVRTVKIGLGLTKWERQDSGSDWVYDSSLIYYKRGGLSHGTYVVPVSVAVSGIPHVINNISVHPNPAANTLTITATEKIVRLSVADITGALVFDQIPGANKIEIDIRNYRPGLYFIRINNTEIRKFMKQ